MTGVGEGATVRDRIEALISARAAVVDGGQR
jgi:hypothetical protein